MLNVFSGGVTHLVIITCSRSSLSSDRFVLEAAFVFVFKNFVPQKFRSKDSARPGNSGLIHFVNN